MPKDVNNVGSTNANKMFDIPLHLQPGQVNTLAFSQDSISSMQMTAKGELEISFRDGSKVEIADFNELADSAKSCGRDTLIQLSDNTIIYPDQLRDQLAQKGGVDFVAAESTDGVTTLDEPKAGQILTKNIEAGHEYKLGFTLDGVNAAQSGHNLLLTFKDGGVLVLNNYFTAVNSDLPPAMTLADGAVIDSNALLTSCKLVEVPNAADAVVASADSAAESAQSGLRQGQAASDVEPASGTDVEPASGDEASSARSAARDTAKANSNQANGADVANIEPAAGGPGAVGNSSRGYGFGSSIDSASFSGATPIGAIDATFLNYTAPTLSAPFVYGTANDRPTLSGAVGTVDETNIGSVSGFVVVNYGNDAPGALTLNTSFTSTYALTSHGVAVDVSVSASGNTYTGTANGVPVFTLTLDPVTGGYTFDQFKPLDHANASDPNDSVALVFGVTATDRDGDAAQTTITINVRDDGPVAVDDGAFVAENTLSVSGNVLTNDNAGTDGLGAVKAVSYNGVSYSVPVDGSVVVSGTYGTLTISSDGTYKYISANTALGTDKFTYTMVDYDGDASTASLTLEVRDLDTVPLVANGSTSLDETGVAADGIESVTGIVSVEYYGDGPGKVAATGSFTSNGSQKADALTSHGVAVKVSEADGIYTGKAGDKVVFTLTINQDGTYKYTQFAGLDHADASNPNDIINLQFGFKATDADGDSSNGIITVKVLDDAPVAVDDGNFIGNDQLSVAGNVLGNDRAGTDGLGSVTKVTFNGVDYTVPTAGTVIVNGVYGVLTIAANGNYTYASSNSALGTDKFTYTMVDYDGDASTANLTLEVRDLDTSPIVANAESTIDETGVTPDGTESISGKVVIDFGADAAKSVETTGSFNAGGSLKSGTLTSHGIDIKVTVADGVYTGKAGDKVVFTLTVNNDGSYKYTQVAGLDHADGTNPNDVINLSFGFKATDADGDSANGIITVRVLDDAPVAVDDGVFLADKQLSINGNVLTNDQPGTDGLGSVTNVSFNSTNYTVPANGTATIVGTYGTLVIASNGAYAYTSSNTAVGTDKFTYTMVDYDGDPSTAKLTVDVQDVNHVPAITNAEITIDETGVAADGTESVSGQVVVDYMGDAAGKIDATGSFSAGGSLKNSALTSNGVAIKVTEDNGVYSGKAGDKLVFTLTINADGTYKYTQVAGLDHADGNNPNDVINLSFGYKATDGDGDSASGIITVKVLDDAPVAADDFATLARAPGSVGGNVTSNDNVGTDKPGYVVKAVSFEGKTVDVPTVGTVSIAGAHGTLTIGATGAYSYSGTTAGKDVFNYQILDADGDAATANLTITVADVNHVPCVTNAEITIDETGVTPDGTESVSGKVSVDYMGDAAGKIDATGSFSAGGSHKNSALTSNGVAIKVTEDNGVYSGKAGDKLVFTLTINADGTYKYTQVAGLDHADGNNPNDVINLSFGYKATDADGDSASGIITVKVLDDAPVAVDDGSISVTKLVTGNILTNDYQGTDAPAPVTKVTLNGVDYQVAATGSTVVTGQHGILTIKADGAYTYAPTHAGKDDFTYTIVDRDGDKSSAHFAFDVKDNVGIDVNINNNCESICIKEDSCVTVPVTANVTGGNGNEVVTLVLTGVAASWNFSAAGWTQTSAGTYSITLPAGQTTYNGSFTFAPPANSDVDLNGLKVTASVFDPDLNATKTDEGHLNISVDAVADMPTLAISLPSNENNDTGRWTFSPYYNYKFYGHGEAYEFNIHAAPTDTDGSEKITYYTIEMHSSVAALGVKFSAGTEVSPGLWRIEAGQEVGLKIIFPEIQGPDGNPWTHPNYMAMQGTHTMNVTAYVQEVNLSGNECDTSDNTSFNCIPVQIIIFSSPLVIDLNHDGIHLTDANNGVYFDINGDGITDKTAWVDKNDGLLALDKNHNGQIDGQSELFGGNTEDGYAVLARYDDNHDGVIDSKDAVWKDLVVWQDANHDGITQNGELITLDHLDFASISLDAKSVDYQISGNGISAESAITGHDGSSTQMVDAWFAFYNGADADQMAEAKANEAAVKTAIAANTPVSESPVVATESDAHQAVVISNFDSKVDKIDLSTLIDNSACSVTTAINDFVFSRTENGSTVISVDASGSGSASAAVDVVVLKDVIVNHVDDIVQIAHQQQQQSGFGTV